MVKSVLGSVAVVQIPIGDEDSLEPVLSDEVFGADGDIIEIRQVQEFEDFPEDVKKAAAGFSEMQAKSSKRK